MKKELGAIVIFLGMILGTSCNKEEMFEKVENIDYSSLPIID